MRMSSARHGHGTNLSDGQIGQRGAYFSPREGRTLGKVSTLDHKILDDAMEDGALVAEPLAGIGAYSLLARA